MLEYSSHHFSSTQVITVLYTRGFESPLKINGVCVQVSSPPFWANSHRNVDVMRGAVKYHIGKSREAKDKGYERRSYRPNGVPNGS